jgi:glutamate-1-semialdehyde aminotransferase
MNNQALYSEAKTLIPGGTQLLSKRPEMFLPDGWVNYYESAKGCEVTDVEGKAWTDMISMGIGTCALGYADPDVDGAIKKAIDKGNMTSLNCYEEVELAQLLVKLHPWADMARFVRSGGEAMSVAVRIARAASHKSKVLFCGYHGWHDWYISANLASSENLDGQLLPGLEPNGIPRELWETSIPFNFNDTEEFLRLLQKYKGEVGAVVLESTRNAPPQKEFMEILRNETRKQGIVLVVDEITAGFRLAVGGAHLVYGLEPDIAVFAKAISNGYPMGAIIGRKEVMEAAQGSFISSTYWTERIGSVAALATIQKMQQVDLPTHLVAMGKAVQDGWNAQAKKYGIGVHVTGIYPLSHFDFVAENPLIPKTVFTKLMLKHGFLASNLFYASYAHTPEIVERYIRAMDCVFAQIVQMDTQQMLNLIDGKVCHSGFKRLN